MLWLYIAAAGAGALLGLLWLPVLAVPAGLIVFVALAVIFMTVRHWPLLQAIVNVFILLATLQIGYLIALATARQARGGRR
jgi:hypothetical protein